MHHKEEQVSINLSNSIKDSIPSSAHHRNDRTQRETNAEEYALDIQQMKEMIKEYREEFVDNSA